MKTTTKHRLWEALIFLTAASAFLAILCLLGSCTSYSEFDPMTGRKTIGFVTTGNIGFTTDKLDDNQSTTSGIASLGGAFDTATASSAMENRGQLASTRIGQLEIIGTIDNSTWVDTVGHWTWRTARAIITGKVLADAIGGLLEADLAETAAGTEAKAIDAGVTTNASDNATTIAIKEIEASTAEAALEAGTAEAALNAVQ